MKLSVGIYGHHSDDYNLIQSTLNYCFKEIEHSVQIVHNFQSLLFRNFNIIFVDVDNEKSLSHVFKMRDEGYVNDIILYAKSKQLLYESLAVHPFDFLIKPLTQDILFETLNAYKNIKGLEERKITVRDSRGKPKFVIPLSHIEYIESSNTKVFFHLKSNRIVQMYEKLINVEKEINDAGFIRCHQSYLVNMDYVNNVDDTFEMISGNKVPIRVRSKKKIKDIYYQYLIIK